MSTNFKGHLEKKTWSQARAAAVAVNPEFAAVIDELSVNDTHWVAEVEYPYGSYVLERAELMLPNSKGDLVPIGDPSLDKEINEGLAYNFRSNPVSLVLNNGFEIFLPLESRTLPFSGVISAGAVFGAWRVLGGSKSEHPVFVWDMTAGARSVFMLPKITEALRHNKLVKEFGISPNLPRNLMQHWHVFRELANSRELHQKPWTAKILYFSKGWFEHLDDPAWIKFYQYFYRSSWINGEVWRNKLFWDLVISLILEKYEARPNAYVIDTAKYLLYMGAGALPGLGPVTNTLDGPFDIIQQIYTDSYGLNNYPPVIVQPKTFDLHNLDADPVYYSLQFPIAPEFKPSTRARGSIITDLHEIRSLMLRFMKELASDKFNISDTSFHKLAQLTQYSYFHNAATLHDGMYDTKELGNDINLRTTIDGKVYDNFPAASAFATGCIQVSHKKLT